jgi:hypothetical protein
MVVGIPQENADQKVRLARASIPEAVVDRRHLTIGMLEIAKVVDTWIPNEDWNDPPEKERCDAFFGPAKGGEYDYPDKKLKTCSLLQILHDATFLGVSEVFHTPSRTTVVDRDAFGRVEDAEEATLDSGPNIPKLFEVGPTILRDVPKSWILE